MRLPTPLFVLVGSLAVVLSACGSTGTSDSTPPPSSAPSSTPSSKAASLSAAKTVTIEAKNWEFNPNRIRVKKGEKLILKITGVEGNHGFVVPDLGINIPLPLNKTVTVEIPTDKTGTFKFNCSIPCGPGHNDMVGVIEVK